MSGAPMDIARIVREALMLDGGGLRTERVPGATLYVRDGAAYGAEIPYVCVIGAFDGLHLGHRALIDAARAEGEARSLPLALVTFVPDPSEVLSKRNPRHLSSDDDRVRSLSLVDPDLIIAFDFTWDFSRNSYETFTLDILGSIVKPVSIHVGEDFTFGADGAGSPSDISRLGLSHGFTAHGHALVRKDGDAISSTRIRRLLEEGDLDEVRALLGRCHMMRASITSGRQGDLFTFDGRSCMPASGDYACIIAIDGFATPCIVRFDSASCSAAVVAPETFPHHDATCSVIFIRLLSDSDDSFSRMWVEQDKIQLEIGEVGA